jgi:site-specific DNA-methyltransferase (adenine-specific)
MGISSCGESGQVGAVALAVCQVAFAGNVQEVSLRLIHADCLEAMAQLVADGVKVDAIITDPPYGTTACKWDSVIPFDKMWPLLNALIKPKGAIVLFGSEPFSSALRMSNIKNYKYDWIWDKVRPSGFQIAKHVPMKRHEVISVFANDGLTWFPIMEKRDKPVKGKVCASSDSSPLKYNDGISRTYDYKNPQSIIAYYKQSDGAYVHPTQKPVALMEYLIKTYTLEGETVLDFTMGSGSTGVACKNTSRNFIGIELDDKYFNIATKRINDATSLF